MSRRVNCRLREFPIERHQNLRQALPGIHLVWLHKPDHRVLRLLCLLVENQ